MFGFCPRMSPLLFAEHDNEDIALQRFQSCSLPHLPAAQILPSLQSWSAGRGHRLNVLDIQHIPANVHAPSNFRWHFQSQAQYQPTNTGVRNARVHLCSLSTMRHDSIYSSFLSSPPIHSLPAALPSTRTLPWQSQSSPTHVPSRRAPRHEQFQYPLVGSLVVKPPADSGRKWRNLPIPCSSFHPNCQPSAVRLRKARSAPTGAWFAKLIIPHRCRTCETRS